MDLDPRLRSNNGHDGPTASASNSGGPATASSGSPTRAVAAHLFPQQARPDGGDGGGGVVDSAEASPLAHQQQESQHQDGDDGSDPKRPRACEACRGLKVRCEPDPNDEGPCKRCKKAGRNCVVTVPTRKRQKKTDSRVAELEKKIDALTASLQARGAPGGPNPSMSPGNGQRNSVDAPTPALNMVWRNASLSWPAPPGAEHSAQQQQPVAVASSRPQDSTAGRAGQKRKLSDGRQGEQQQHQQRPSQEPPSELPSLETAAIFSRLNNGDIIDRGVLSLERATELFDRYNHHMVLHLPAVIFAPSVTLTDLRKEKPLLFHAVMAAATSESPALQKVLQKELMAMFAEKVVITGEKNVEIVQALQVAVIWYWPPEHFEELKFYQLVHMAAVMAVDIGLGQKVAPRRQTAIPEGYSRANLFRRSQLPDPATIENRRAWLTCYFLAVNTSMALHRPNLIRWNPFMSECVEMLNSSPYAAPTDKYFCHLVWTHRLGEEAGIQFSLDDPTASVNITDPRTQYALKGLERDLEKYSSAVAPDLMQPTLKLSFHMLNLYMHEMALHSRAGLNQMGPPYATDSLRDGILPAEPLSAAHISALAACLSGITGMLTTFLELDIFSIRCLPVFNFVRVAYAIVILIKLSFSASAPGSELGRVISKEDMRVEYMLDALLDKFRATAAEDRSRPAAKFLVVLVMLRSWFYKQSKEEGKQQTPTPTTHASTPQQLQTAPGPSQTANTPLQLLSEVATGGGASAGAANNNPPTTTAPLGKPPNPALFSTWTGIRQPSQPFFHDSTPAANATSTPPSVSQPQPPHDPSNADLVAAMAPGIPTALPNGQGGFMSELDYGLNGGFDLEGWGLGVESQDAYESGARLVMNEPWFSEMFQHMPGTGPPGFNF